jgi:hypothetical protein
MGYTQPKHNIRLTIQDLRNILNALHFQQREWRGPADTWPAAITEYRICDQLDELLAQQKAEGNE